MSRVALITGGGSGMGFQVAQILVQQKGWLLHLIDVNPKAGEKAVELLGSSVATFHHADITKYDQLSQAFLDAFQDQGRLDFVYANAGISESGDVYAVVDQADISREPNQLVVDINLKSVINTSYLAAHYFRLSPHKGQDADLVITASAGSLYPLESAPMYAAGKFGALGFMWSIARVFRARWGIRVNAVLPAPVATNLVASNIWESFEQSLMTPVTQVASVVVQFLEHGLMCDANGVQHAAEDVFGLAAEVITDKFYFRAPPQFCDEKMEKVMAGNDL